MLVIVSDLHLTDKTSGTTIDSNAFRIFYFRLQSLAYAASKREVDGAEVGRPNEQRVEIYKPVDHIHLLLLGDIFDVIRSAKWLSGDVRPWHDPKTPGFISRIQEITNDIVAKNKDAIDVLRSLANHGFDIQETTAAKKDHVSVSIHYLAGNHDRFYGFADPALNPIRKSIVDAMGLDNDPSKPFPATTDDLPAIKAICDEHQVFAQHGDKFDGSNHGNPDRNYCSIGDAIVIELLNRFGEEVKPLGDEVAEGLRELDNIRPVELIPTYVDGLLRRSANKEQAEEVRRIWKDVVRRFLKNDFVRECRSSFTWVLWLSGRFSFHRLAKLVPRLKSQLISLANIIPFLEKIARKRGLIDEYFRCAESENAFQRKDISYIVYGHTHRHEIVPLRSGTGSGTNHEDIYINSGTWRPVFEECKYRPENEEFFAYHVMTYLAFYKGDERNGKAFEAWSGSLEYPVATELPASVATKTMAAKAG